MNAVTAWNEAFSSQQADSCQSSCSPADYFSCMVFIVLKIFTVKRLILVDGKARIYYEDVGMGEPIITVHGLSEDGNYWSETGVAASLKEKYRVISMDMRGHGRTMVESEPFGFDADTMAAYFDALIHSLLP
jgi:hypothetical protein